MSAHAMEYPQNSLSYIPWGLALPMVFDLFTILNLYYTQETYQDVIYDLKHFKTTYYRILYKAADKNS